ncbi:hypothetical protein HOE04_02640 [archaeon]|jgi:hypothetical protein|nr:hypothetical protein [archaeon]
MRLEDKCPDCETIQGVSYCKKFDTECREEIVGVGNINIHRYRRPYGDFDAIILCDGDKGKNGNGEER